MELLYPSNLPAQLITLLGRDAELETLESLLLRDDLHLLTLTGPPGVGKTSLALQVASSLSQERKHSLTMAYSG